MNTPGLYRVHVFKLDGTRYQDHDADGTYDSRHLALEAVIDACDDTDVGHVEFDSNEAKREFNLIHDLKDMPTDPNEKFIGAWRCPPPQTGQWVYHITWHAEEPIGNFRYLIHTGNEAPHFMGDPHAWQRLPRP